MRLDRAVRFVIHDGGGQYTRAFDDVFSAVGAEAITTPPRAPRANVFAERWVRSVRHELLDRTIIWNERQLRALLGQYVAHDDEHRPHRSLGQRAPASDDVAVMGSAEPIQRYATCGGLINEYRTAARPRGPRPIPSRTLDSTRPTTNLLAAACTPAEQKTIPTHFRHVHATGVAGSLSRRPHDKAIRHGRAHRHKALLPYSYIPNTI